MVVTWTLCAVRQHSLMHGITAHRMIVALVLILLLPACGAVPASRAPDGPWRPLSRLTVHNQHAEAAYLRANWVEGKEQTSFIPVGDPLAISGSIGGGFPASVEILDATCAVIGRLADQPGETQAMITISSTGLALDPITTTERAWNVAEVVDDCPTRPDIP